MSEPDTAPVASTATAPRQTPDRLDSPLHVGDPLPNAMGAGELMRALNLRPGIFYVHQKAGKFKRFEFRRPVSHAKRYSGALVKRYLDQSGETR